MREAGADAEAARIPSAPLSSGDPRSAFSRNKPLRICAAALILLTAAALRFPGLRGRPMHADEATLADKLGAVLQTGRFAYDPSDHHGPALAYVTAIPARIAGARDYGTLNETMVRAVPAAAGTALAALPLAFAGAIGWPAALAAAALTAVSPAMVYYSRYYIPEMLLVLFSFCTVLAGWRYARSRSAAWAAATGLCAGLMLATKETAILAFAAMALGALWLRAWRVLRLSHLLVALAMFVGVLALAFGGALPELFGSFGSYTSRALTRHVHPWTYYLGLLAWFREAGGPRWTEGIIVILAVIGASQAFRGKLAFAQYLTVYGAILAVAYSAIPYKTPWNALGFWHAFILLAGIGAAEALRRPGVPRAVAAVLLSAGVAHLGWQAHRAAFPLAADPANPYVYAHTTRDVYAMQASVERIADAHPEKRGIAIQVFSKENVWPLPWYLRSFPQVEWWNGIPQQAQPAPLILVTPSLEPALAELLYERRPPGQRELYVTVFEKELYLRPGVPVRAYALKSLWDAAQPAP